MRQAPSEERRRHERFPVTVSARVVYAAMPYRTEILDVSTGGMLLAPIDALTISARESINIESPVFGRIEAIVVSQSETGIHIAADLSPMEFQDAIERLFLLSRTWMLK
ncbi:PilZ domain-containing protein [Methylobacterium brachythecii]|nr:PilZ domain-containing protein [Methylobacterium brachythecii]